MSISPHRRSRLFALQAAALALLMAAGTAVLTGCGSQIDEAQKLDVVTSSTLLGSAVADIGGDSVTVESIIAPGSCPGHYDLSPRDTRMISSAGLVLTHGYEVFVDRLAETMGSRRPRVTKILIDDNWLKPDVYVRGAREVTRALCDADPRNSARYTASLASLEESVNSLSDRLLERLAAAGASGEAVLCADQQAPFVEWMGFKVAHTYARAEEFTPADLSRLNSIARERKIRLVIDNLQSGPTAGKQLAADIGAAHVVLSNFPGGFPDTDSWAACLEDNVDRVLQGLAQ